MKIKQLSAFLTLFIFILVSSCQYDFIELPELDLDDDPDEQPVVSFAAEIVPIFENKCNSCHGGSVAPNLSANQAYNSIVPNLIDEENPLESRIYKHAAPTASHPATYTQDEAQKLILWIRQGAEDN